MREYLLIIFWLWIAASMLFVLACCVAQKTANPRLPLWAAVGDLLGLTYAVYKLFGWIVN